VNRLKDLKKQHELEEANQGKIMKKTSLPTGQV